MGRLTEFYGYIRQDGSVGVRNHVAIIGDGRASNPVARRISASVKGTVCLVPSFAPPLEWTPRDRLDKTMLRYAANPNTFACLVVGLNAEWSEGMAARIASMGKPVEWISMPESGGTLKCTEKGISIASKMVSDAGKMKREPASFSSLVIGVKCGGSDATSGFASNPATGQVSDWVVEAGGTVILGEISEIIGAEDFILPRAESPKVADDIMAVINRYEDLARQLGVQLTNTSSGQRISGDQAGLTTSEEKSLGAYLKAGTTRVREVISFGQKPSKKGLVFMDAPGIGNVNISALSAGGAQILIFSTGAGNPLGHPLSPTIKVSGNPNTVVNVADNIDVDVSSIIRGEKSVADAAEALYQELIDVANGKMTRNEILGDVEVALS